MGMFFHDLWSEWPAMLNGLKMTLILSGLMTASGLVGGFLLLFCLTQPLKWLQRAAHGYITFFIGTPLLALLFLMYYGLPTVGVDLSPFLASFLGFTLNVSAYNARYLMTGYKAINRDELTAALTLGFGRRQRFLLLIAPQSMRYALPGLVNQAINNLKDSTVAFLIQFDGFLTFIQNFTASNFFFFRGYLFAAAVYLVMVFVLTLAARSFEHRIRTPGFAH